MPYKVLHFFHDEKLNKDFTEKTVVEYEKERADEINAKIKKSHGFDVLEAIAEKKPKATTRKKKED
jgi:hypothetical protein